MENANASDTAQKGRNGQRGSGRGNGGRGKGGRHGSREHTMATRLRDKSDTITLPEIGLETPAVKLKPIVLEWLNRHYPKVSSVAEDQCYRVPPYPTEEKIKEQWSAMQCGDMSAVLGVEGAVFDDGQDHTGIVNEYQFDMFTEVDTKCDELSEDGKQDESAEIAPVQPRPVMPENLQRKVYHNAYQTWQEECEKINEQRKRAFDELWNRFSPGLRGAIIAFKEYNVVKAQKDLLKLYKMLLVSLASKGTTDMRHRRQMLRDQYLDLIKFPGQSLEKFREIFDDRRKQLAAAGVVIDEVTAADDFLRKLDKTFDDLKNVQARTGTYPGATYYGVRPETVDDMFRAAQNELMVIRRLNLTKPSTMSSTTKVGNRHGAAYTGSGKREEGKCRKCGGTGHKQADCTSKDGVNVECYGCGGVGHYKSKCPSKGKSVASEEDSRT